MENAAKALAITAGVTFSLLIISLLFVLYNRLSSYYDEKSKMTEIEQIQEINARFENYSGKTIRGNELISIMNSIIDYNNLQADMQGYERIKINVDLKGHASELTYSGNINQVDVFDSDGNISNNINDEQIKRLTEITVNAQNKVPGLTHSKLNKIFQNPDKKDDILSDISGDSGVNNENINDYIEIYNIFANVKKVKFECTKVLYNPNTGRVNGVIVEAFEEVEEDSDGNIIRKLKMD